MKLKSCILAMLCPFLSKAQQAPAIGTTLHDSIIMAVPAQKNQLIIVDFFATWCSSCAKALPELDSLQTQFGNRLSIRLVSSYGTGDTKEKINAYFLRRKKPTGQQYSFPVIYNDSLLKNSFPHQKIPHYVWIYNGKLIAITRSKEVTSSNIKKVLQGKHISLPVKIDDDALLKKPKQVTLPGTHDSRLTTHASRLPIHHSPFTLPTTINQKL